MSKNSTKWHYEFTDWCKYKCLECGRTMHEPSPHICNGQFKKHRNFAKGGDLTYSTELPPLSEEQVAALRELAYSDERTLYFDYKPVAKITRLPEASKEEFDKLIDYILKND